MFQFPTYPLITLLFHVMIPRHLRLDEFPHSDICGSRIICIFPQLFAACHVLHRLLIPRHSPYALISLTFYLSILFFWILFIRLFPSLIILRVTYISIIAKYNLLYLYFILDTCYLCLFISIFVVIIHYIVFNVQFQSPNGL